MVHSQEAILTEIDATIDQLLENAKALKKISSNEAYQDEVCALEKTQESLIAHLMHMDEILKKQDRSPEQKPLLTANVHDKLGKAGYLNKVLCKAEASLPQGNRKPKIHKRKTLVTHK